MTELFQTILLRVTVAGVASAVALRVAGGGALREIVKMAAGLLMLLALLQPLSGLHLLSWEGWTGTSQEEIDAIGARNAQTTMSTVAATIARSLEQRAEQEGFDCSVEVTMENDADGILQIGRVTVYYGGSANAADRGVRRARRKTGVDCKMKKPDAEWLNQMGEKILPLVRKYRALLIVLLAGVLLLASGGLFGGRPEPQAAAAAGTEAAEQEGFSLPAFEADLNDKLAAIEGVGRVELMLSLDQTEEAVYAVNTRQTNSDAGGQSFESDLTVVSDGSYGETPVTVKNLLPTFRGAVVLCDGADDAGVRLAVTQAVSTVCGIGSDKVTVLKMAAGS